MEVKKRKIYDKRFRESAVKQVVDDGRRVSEVSRDLGIHENQLYAWKRKYLDEGINAFPGHGKQLGEKAELRRLQEENRKLRIERDILKKVVGIFSEPSSKNSDS